MDIKNSFKIKAESEAVYSAISTVKGIRGWWCKDSEIALTEGGEHSLNFLKEGKPVVMKFKIDELSPNRKVVWTCTENGNPTWIGTQLIWEIDEDGAFRFNHANFDDKYAETPPVQMTEQGWKHFMSSLKSYCETGEGQPW